MLQSGKQPARRVSNAVYPANVYYHVATGKMAQWRRFFVLIASQFSYALSLLYIRHVHIFLSHTAVVRIVRASFLLFLLSDAFFLLAALYHRFRLLNTWLVCALFSLVIAGMVAYVLAGAKMALRISRARIRLKRSIVRLSTLRPERRVLPPMPQVPRSRLGQLIPRTLLPVEHRFPETPMPVPPTPLIRVLETIDLSSTDIEHFLDSKPLPSALLVASKRRRGNDVPRTE